MTLRKPVTPNTPPDPAPLGRAYLLPVEASDSLIHLVRILARQAARDYTREKDRSRGQMALLEPAAAVTALQLLTLIVVVVLRLLDVTR